MYMYCHNLKRGSVILVKREWLPMTSRGEAGNLNCGSCAKGLETDCRCFVPWYNCQKRSSAVGSCSCYQEKTQKEKERPGSDSLNKMNCAEEFDCRCLCLSSTLSLAWLQRNFFDFCLTYMFGGLGSSGHFVLLLWGELCPNFGANHKQSSAKYFKSVSPQKNWKKVKK